MWHSAEGSAQEGLLLGSRIEAISERSKCHFGSLILCTHFTVKPP
jgi:hypothetical protein